jgi:hypothetical protein
MSAPAEVILKTVAGNQDKILILNNRCQMVLPFQAPNWTDLRVGFFLSLCSTSVDDPPSPITGLAETIPNGANGLGPQYRYWIGVKDSGTALPKNPVSAFIGFSNASAEDATVEHSGSSRLVSSDAEIGTTNAYFWRPDNSAGISRSGGIWQGPHPRALSRDGLQQHFPQNTGTPGAGGYATLLAFRITRPSADSNAITVEVPFGPHHQGEVMVTNTPTLDLLQSTLNDIPGANQLWRANMDTMPDALYLYWPFNLSRLRCHALGILSK